MSVVKSIDNGILILTISRESALNALNKDILQSLHDEISYVHEHRHEFKGVIITGAGPKAFVAGADIAEFQNLNQLEARCLSEKGQGIFSLIERLPITVIAAVNGFALGGGCELAMACHMRIAGNHAKFGQPEVNLGLIPGYGGTQRLIRYIGRGKAIEMMLTGDMMTAQDALTCGLVNHVVEPGQELEKAKEIILKIANKAPLAVGHVIKCVNAYYESNSGVFDIEADKFGQLVISEDGQEGVNAFLEKRKANFKGA